MPGKPLNRYADDEETVCGGCNLQPSKPESLDERSAAAAGDALALAELQRSGATFAYPNALTPAEWSMIAAVTRGLDRAETLRQERERKTKKRTA